MVPRNFERGFIKLAFIHLDKWLEKDYTGSTYDERAVREPRRVVFPRRFVVPCGRRGGEAMCAFASSGVSGAVSLSAGPVSMGELRHDRRNTVFERAVRLGRMDLVGASDLARRLSVLDEWISAETGYGYIHE